MNESTDRVLAAWLHEGPKNGPSDGLERVLAATRSVGQRPGWTLLERWLPMQLTMGRLRSQRPILAIVTLALIIVALAATAIYVGSQRFQPLPPPFRNGAIMYARDGDLFIADQLGGTPRTLVAGVHEDRNPVFSPLGDRIAFVRTAADGNLIMSVRLDGSGVAELANVPESIDLRLAWAPDGRALLASGHGTYVRGPDGGAVMGVGPDSRRLYVLKADGSGYRTLDAGPRVTAGPASWRPDGRHIGFMGWQENGHVASIYIADADGTNIRRLQIESVTGSRGLDWSPDGTRISLSIGGPGGMSQATIADIDVDGNMMGSRQVQFGPSTSVESTPVWSPDGTQLAVVLRSGSRFHIGVARPDGSDYRIVGDAAVDGIAWSPDGRSLVITGNVHDVEKAWLVDLATGERIEVPTPVDSWQRLAP